METPPFPPTAPTRASVSIIRAAFPDDLIEAAQVYQTAAKALFDDRRTSNPWDSPDARDVDRNAAIAALRAIIADHPDAVQVAERHGEIVGIGAVVIRERHAHILFLFVDPAWQRKGIGRALLERLREVILIAGAEVVTLTASEDRRAWHRYLAMGLYPGMPIVSMRAPAIVFPEAPSQEGLELHPVSRDRPEILKAITEIDHRVKGARRLHDLERWILEDGATGSLLTRKRDGRPLGYFMISRDARHGQIGPVAAVDRDRFSDVLHHALHAAGTIDGARQLIWRIEVPGDNQVAIAPLLAAGFHPWNLLPWFANGKIGQWDRYIFRDEDQL